MLFATNLSQFNVVAKDLEKNILLVDDSENDALLLQRQLQTAGLANPVIWVSSGRKAMAYLKGEPPYEDRLKHPMPSVLILDVKMPDMDGFAILRWISTQPQLNPTFATQHDF